MVGAETGDERGVGAGARGRHSLIQALAARVLGEVTPEDGFARSGQTFDRCDEIEVAAPDHHDVVGVKTHGFIEPWSSRRRQLIG